MRAKDYNGHMPEEPAEQWIQADLDAAGPGTWLTPVAGRGVTRHGVYRTEWDGEPFPVTVTQQTA